MRAGPVPTVDAVVDPDGRPRAPREKSQAGYAATRRSAGRQMELVRQARTPLAVLRGESCPRGAETGMEAEASGKRMPARFFQP